MKLALLYLNKGGGIANCTYELAKALSKDHDVTCYMSSENQLLPRFDNLSCKVRDYTWSRGRIHLTTAMLSNRDTTGIAKEILADGPDLVLDTGSWWWRGVVFTELKGKIPIAEIVHDPKPHPGSMQLFYNLHYKLFPPKADIAIALSDYCYDEIVQQFPSKHHIRSKHGIIISPDSISPPQIATMRKQMLYFGRIEPYKGIDILADAYQIAKTSMPDISLTIAGEGKIAPNVLEKIEASDITLLNAFIPESDINQLIGSHGLMILPYTYATQSGVAAVALANGLPCVATSVGALPEQVQNGRNGLIVAPGDPERLAEAMVAIASDYDLAKRMSEESCRIGNEEYSWDNIGQTLIEDLEKAILEMRKER